MIYIYNLHNIILLNIYNFIFYLIIKKEKKKLKNKKVRSYRDLNSSYWIQSPMC